MSNNLPIATQWTLNATAVLPSQVVLSVALVASTSTGQKGTGWLVSNRHIVTNEHVVHGGSVISVLVQFSDGVVFTATDGQGKIMDFVESQIVAEILQHFQGMTQVVLGEAIAAEYEQTASFYG